MLASERSVPPNQIGRMPVQVADHDPVGVPLADRDLVDPDDARAPECPTRRSCSRMYCFSSSLTVSQSRCSLLGHILDRRRPGSAGRRRTQTAWCRTDCRPATPAARASPSAAPARAPAAPPAPGRSAASPHDRSPHPAAPSGRRNPDATGRTPRTPFFSPPHQPTMRAFGSPNTPRTVASGRSPESGTRPAIVVACASPIHAKFLRSARNAQTLVPCGFPAPTASLSTHSIP